MTVVPRDLRWSVSCTAKSILLQFDAHLMELLRERLCLDPVVLRAAILWGYCFTVSLFFHVRESVSAREGCWLKLFIDCLQGGVVGCWLFKHLMCPLVLFYIPRHACAAIVEGLPGLQLDWLDCMISWYYGASFLGSVCVHHLWVIQYTEGWNTPKYSLNGWLSLKAHHKILNNYLIFTVTLDFYCLFRDWDDVYWWEGVSFC